MDWKVLCSLDAPIHISFTAFTRSCILDNDDADDDAVESEGAGEDLDDEHFHEGSLLLGLNQGGAGADDADREATSQVSESDDETSSEHRKAFSLCFLEISKVGLALPRCVIEVSVPPP